MTKIKQEEYKVYSKVQKSFDVDDLKQVFESMHENGIIIKGVELEDINWNDLYENFYEAPEMTTTKRCAMENAINKYIVEKFKTTKGAKK